MFSAVIFSGFIILVVQLEGRSLNPSCNAGRFRHVIFPHGLSLTPSRYFLWHQPRPENCVPGIRRNGFRTESRKELLCWETGITLWFTRARGFAQGILKVISHPQQRSMRWREGRDSPKGKLGQTPEMFPLGPGCVWLVQLVSELQVQNCFKCTLYVTFLGAFLSYCKYRDSTILPPVRDTQLVYNKTTACSVKDPPVPRMPTAHPESWALSALPAQPWACMRHLLYARRRMRHLLYIRASQVIQP